MNDTFQRRIVPRRGISVPVFGLGGAALGGMHGLVTESEAASALDTAWDAGFRYFDTAPLYGHGLGELRTGASLRSRARETYILSSKVGWRMAPRTRSEPVAKGKLPFDCFIDYSFDGTIRSVEDSLIRLGLDRLDLIFVHDVDPYNHGENYRARFVEVLGGALPALQRLRDEGIVGAIGIGVNNCDVCLDFIREAEPDCFLLAGRYSLLDRRAEAELLPMCLQKGIAVIVGAPFNSGILAKGRGGRFNYREDMPSNVAKFVDEAREACDSKGVSLMAAALHFPLRHEAVVSVLPGPRSRDQIAGISEAASQPIPETLWTELDSIHRVVLPTI